VAARPIHSRPSQRVAPEENRPYAVARLIEQAVLDRREGLLDRAVEAYRAALSYGLQDFEAHSGLGLIFLQQSKSEAAAEQFRLASVKRPHAADAHHALGVALLSLRRYAEAIASFEAALALEPRMIEALNDLGLARLAAGQPQAAIVPFERALALAPAHVGSHRGVGASYRALGQFDAAIVHFRQATALSPAVAPAHNELGCALQIVNRPHEALESFDRAIAVNPAYADAHHHRGNALEQLGRLEEAGQAFERAVELAPGRAEHYYGLARHRRFTGDDPVLAAMEALAEREHSLRSNTCIELRFALAKACDDVERYADSFRHLSVGNAAKRAALGYNERGTLAMFERIRAVFSRDAVRRCEGYGEASALPVFVLGMPRSGTTLVEQIVGAHPAAFGAGEISDFGEAAKRLGHYPEMIAGLQGLALAELGAEYVARLAALAPSALRIVNKMPANFFYVGLIRAALPNARIVHVVRDPIETCFSCYSKLFTAGQAHTYDLAELGRYYRAYAALMAHWRDLLGPESMLEVRYEDVVENLEQEARRIVTYCGLPWDDACLAFHRSDRVVKTASIGQVRRSIYRSSLHRTRPYITYLRPLIDALNEGAPAA
jgi:tetratricopeptide (TPR) repeat protein